jgi:hypothetical protein
MNPALADGLTGKGLLALCSVAPSEPPSLCEAYLLGLTDALFFMQVAARRGNQTCMPEDGEIGVPDALRIFREFAEKNPSMLDMRSGVAAPLSIIAAYKCPNSN